MIEIHTYGIKTITTIFAWTTLDVIHKITNLLSTLIPVTGTRDPCFMALA